MGLLLPSFCVLCDSLVFRTISLCESCENDFPLLENACQTCGLPLNIENKNNTFCGHCLQGESSVDYTRCLYHYQAPLDYLITNLKYKQQLSYAAILGDLLLRRLQKLEQWEEGVPDCIIPVPLHRGRLVKRGFNQSLEIVRPVAKKLNISIDVKTVRRKRQTLAQADLNAVQRNTNVKGCFEIQSQKAVNYHHVVIIDDVVTTGSTINELAKQLKQSGVQKVGVWSIARAILAQ
jgi:ComF family protein